MNTNNKQSNWGVGLVLELMVWQLRTEGRRHQKAAQGIRIGEQGRSQGGWWARHSQVTPRSWHQVWTAIGVLEKYRQGRWMDCGTKATGTDWETEQRAGPWGKTRYKLTSQANGPGNRTLKRGSVCGVAQFSGRYLVLVGSNLKMKQGKGSGQ